MLIHIGGVECVRVKEGCTSSCKFILNSHLHALTRGNYRLKKKNNINAGDVKNKSKSLRRRLYHIGRKWIRDPGEVFSTFPPSALFTPVSRTSNQLLEG